MSTPPANPQELASLGRTNGRGRRTERAWLSLSPFKPLQGHCVAEFEEVVVTIKFDLVSRDGHFHTRQVQFVVPDYAERSPRSLTKQSNKLRGAAAVWVAVRAKIFAER
jgi:hypothetical protein